MENSEKKLYANRLAKKDMPESFEYVIYTNGVCPVDPGVGGFAIVAVDQHNDAEPYTVSERCSNTTARRMQINAIIKALESTSGDVKIVANNLFVIKCAVDMAFDPNNKDLWDTYQKASRNRKVVLTCAPDHKNDEYYKECCKLALAIVRDCDLKTDSTGGDASYRESGRRSVKPKPRKIPAEYEQEPENMSVREYMRRYLVYRQCAQSVIDFYSIVKLRREHKDGEENVYKSLRTGGSDFWSISTREELLEETGEGIMPYIREYLQDDFDIDTCLRWKCRGLTLSDAIEKAKLNEEYKSMRRSKRR